MAACRADWPTGRREYRSIKMNNTALQLRFGKIGSLIQSRFLGWLLILASAVFFALSAPIREGFIFGGDEGYELYKGFLFEKGFALYSEIWNDQPPLHTWLLAALFHITGPSLLAARLAALGFTLS